MKIWVKIILISGLGILSSSEGKAQFLDFSQPARAIALGGNLVALPEGSSAFAFNPAGLSLQKRFEVSARYESLFTGLENDSISTGNITALTDPTLFGVLGASWDHLGSNLIAQDRFQLAWGKAIPVGGFFQDVGLGFSLSYLTQRYTLLTPLTGVSLSNLSSGAFTLGAGLLVSLQPGLSLGISAADINQPQLGIVGIDQQPTILRLGLAAELFKAHPVRLTLTANQSLTKNDLNSFGGMEFYFPGIGVRLRGGAGPYQGAVGLGYELADLFLDYAYSFSIAGVSAVSNAAPPGSNMFELGFQWGNPPAPDVYELYFKKAQEAEAQRNWRFAYWYYHESFKVKRTRPALEGLSRVLVPYNLDRALKCYLDGKTAEQKGLWDEAANNYELAVKLAPSNADYASALVKAVTEAAELNEEKNIADLIWKISGLLAKKQDVAANHLLNQALRTYPHQPALVLIQKSLHPTAALAPRAVPVTIQGPPTEKESNAKLAITEAELYLAHGRLDLAKRDLAAALAAQPKNVEIKTKLAELEVPTPVVLDANRQLAQDLYETGLKRYLDDDLSGAIHDWEQAFKADPTNTKVQNNLIRAKIEENVEHP